VSLRPRSDEILASILESFEEIVMPELTDDYAVSAGHTIVNLLRHLQLRVELERPALVAEIDALEPLLADVVAFVDARAGTGGLEPLAPCTGGPDVRTCTNSELVQRVGELRASLDTALRLLQQARDALGGDAEYVVLRDRIRRRVLEQIDTEATWITPAFRGIRR